MEKDKNLIPSLPKGFRDRWGKELALKKKILSKIRMYNDTKMINHPLSNIISQTKLLEKLADQYGTPTYVYSKSRLEHNISELMKKWEQRKRKK